MHKLGLIIGKFMPFHSGHSALVDFSLKHCDKLIVAVCTDKAEPIPGKIRYFWVKQIYQNEPRVEVKHVWAKLPHNPVPTERGNRTWGTYLKKRFPKTDVIFSSEPYGPSIAKRMGVAEIMFDVKREKVRISATMIRQDPQKYKAYVADVARSYFKIK